MLAPKETVWLATTTSCSPSSDGIPPAWRAILSNVSMNLAAGRGDHFVHCGTLTVNEEEWEAFIGALRECLGVAVEVREGTQPRIVAS